MKRIIALMTIAFLMAVSVSAETDYSAMETDELYQAYDAVLAELFERSMPAANAGAHTEKEILFRDIPWGASPAEFAEAMKAIGIQAGFNERSMPSVEMNIQTNKLESVYTVKNNSGYFSNPYAKDLKVGGVSVSYIGAYFHYGFNDDEVYTDQSQAKLYRAYYFFNPADFTASYEMLREKLCTLYGKAEDVQAAYGAGSVSVNRWTMWENGDASLCLYYFKRQNNETMYLYYGVSDSVGLLTELEAAMAREELEEGMEDMSGL